MFSGPLRIYRVLGSVAFLSSGNTLHPILAKSQCWCVDGESKFVLRIRANAYYRIELPMKTLEDKHKTEELKSVMANVLQFETTPCPFQRGFTVTLPKPPPLPVQKRPWRPKPRVGTTAEQSLEESDRFDVLAKNTFDIQRAGAAGTDTIGAGGRSPELNALAHSDVSSTGSTENEHGSVATDDTAFTQRDHEDIFEESDNFTTPTRPKPSLAGRAISAPVKLTLKTAPTPNSDINSVIISKATKAPSSLSSSLDSFHSFHSPISPLLPSPPLPDLPSLPPESDAGIEIFQASSHTRDVSETTIKPESPELWDMTNERTDNESGYHSSPELPQTPTLVSDLASQDEDHWSEAVTPSPPTELRHRDFGSKQRTHSPLPSSSNLYSPYSPRTHMSGHHLTTAILQKTCSLLLGPPVQLVALMLRIAAKLAKGSFRGTSFGFGDDGQRIPCSWDFSDSSDGADDLWEEDDYGVSLRNMTSMREIRAKEVGGSWEID